MSGWGTVRGPPADKEGWLGSGSQGCWFGGLRGAADTPEPFRSWGFYHNPGSWFPTPLGCWVRGDMPDLGDTSTERAPPALAVPQGGFCHTPPHPQSWAPQEPVVTSSPCARGIAVTLWCRVPGLPGLAGTLGRWERVSSPASCFPLLVCPSPSGWWIWTPTCGSPGPGCMASPWSMPSPRPGSGLMTSRATLKTSWWSPSPDLVSVLEHTSCAGPGLVSVLHGQNLLPGGTQHIWGCRDRDTWWRSGGAVGAKLPSTSLVTSLSDCCPQAPPGSVRSRT